jgi:hypothetical protein
MAQWRKVVVSGSTAELKHISASGNIIPISDNGSDLGSTALEWKDLYIDGTANIDSLVADTADINAGTVDAITSLTAAGNLDIGTHGFRANTLTADAQTSGRVAIYSTAGLLSEDSDLTFSGDTLTATKIGAFEAAGSIDFSDETMTNVDIDSGAIDGTPIGANSHQTVKGTTIDATTDFTIDGLVLTADTITNDSNLTMDLAGDLAIDVDGGDVTITDDGANLATINATKISGSLASTGSFGRVIAATFSGDGAGITGLTSAAIDGVAGMTNNYVITATGATAVTGEANLQFDGTDVVVAGGGKVAFRDNGGEYIYSVSDNVLGLAAGSEIDLTATTIDINGLVDISGNLTVGGNLDVNGTVTTIDTVNLLISESFATYASGSTTAVDGGFGVQYNADGRARSYGWDASATRWSFQNDLNVTGSIISPDAYVATVETGTGAGDSQSDPTYGGATGYGNIYIDTDDGEIWIYA